MPVLHRPTPATEMWVSHHLLPVQYQMTQLTLSLVGQDSGLLSMGSSLPPPTTRAYTGYSVSKRLWSRELPVFVPPRGLMCCAWSSAGWGET